MFLTIKKIKMVIGFKKQFVPKILDGTKQHTMREDANNRWKVGMKMHMATGVRTKGYNQFAEKICTGIQNVEIKWRNPPADSFPFQGRSVKVFIDGKNISNNDEILDNLVEKDGFNDRKEFFTWFSEDFTGKILHWTDFKY